MFIHIHYSIGPMNFLSISFSKSEIQKKILAIAQLQRKICHKTKPNI